MNYAHIGVFYVLLAMHVMCVMLLIDLKFRMA